MPLFLRFDRCCYNFDFLTIQETHNEKELMDALLNDVSNFFISVKQYY